MREKGLASGNLGSNWCSKTNNYRTSTIVYKPHLHSTHHYPKLREVIPYTEGHPPLGMAIQRHRRQIERINFQNEATAGGDCVGALI